MIRSGQRISGKEEILMAKRCAKNNDTHFSELVFSCNAEDSSEAEKKFNDFKQLLKQKTVSTSTINEYKL